MGKIIVLDELTCCKIAAGEVVERPASVVKEMAENSIDAGADKISVEIRGGGVKFIKIEDNGSGFEPDDVIIAFDKHATSKIRTSEDLDYVTTLGFRGEALASIAAVSKLKLVTRKKENDIGLYVVMEGGDLIETGECGSKAGSIFTVENLFYNTPARYKFLKKDIQESSMVCDVLQKLALSHPDVSFKLVSDGKLLLQTPGNGDLQSAIHSIFGKQISSFILPVDYQLNGIGVTGYCGIKEAVYGNRTRQFTFVNGRNIKSKTITAAIDEAYKTVTMKGKFPFVVLTVTVPQTTIDVNVSPQKTEVRFQDDGSIFRAVYHAVKGAIFGENESSEIVKPEVVVTAKTAEIKPDFKTPTSRATYTTTENKVSFKNDMSDRLKATYISLFDKADELSKINTNTINKNSIKTEDFPSSAAKNESVNDNKTLSVAEETAEETAEKTHEAKYEAVKSLGETTLKDNGKAPVYGSETLGSKITFSNKPEETATPLGDNDVFINSTVIGQIFDTYLILEYRNKMVLLDQHAAHERLMYEKIKYNLDHLEPESQMMLVPVMVDLSASEMAVYKNNTEYFEKLGFEIDYFGNDTLAVRSIPMILKDTDIKEYIISGIGLAEGGKTEGTLFSDHAVFTMACKAAIKGNHHLSADEINALLKDLSSIKSPGTCPHGRPIIITMSQYEIERKFHRC